MRAAAQRLGAEVGRAVEVEADPSGKLLLVGRSLRACVGINSQSYLFSNMRTKVIKDTKVREWEEKQ
jgi:hypothetical protein